jgi:hypothetical protein
MRAWEAEGARVSKRKAQRFPHARTREMVQQALMSEHPSGPFDLISLTANRVFSLNHIIDQVVIICLEWHMS